MNAGLLSGLPNVSVRVDGAPASTLVGEKLTVMLGTAETVTARLAVAANALLPLPVMRPPIGNVSVYMLAIRPSIVTVMVQLPPAGIEPPEKLIVVLTVLTLDPQVVLGMTTADVVSPPGRVMLPDEIGFGLPPALLNVMVNVVLEPVGMLAAPSARATGDTATPVPVRTMAVGEVGAF
ncbi:MAG TPA: hypothetical protein PLY50_07870, partial [Burkholderiaceae bacterium]|nr:hypothetical protein [Burkholderiaceae bacterium]